MTTQKNLETTPADAEINRALTERGENILAAQDLAHQVSQLEPLEAYYISRDLGLGKALPILLALSDKQLETCVDLDCWSRHDFTADSLDEWLTAFALAGPDTLAESFFNLNYVVQLLFLAQTVIVFDPDTDEVPPQEEDGPDRAMTPDGFYLLELKTELDLKLHPFSVLDALYLYDAHRTHQLLSEVRVDLQLQIEEEALRFRNGRMEDLGFVTPDEAVSLFSRPGKCQPVTRPKKLIDQETSRLPAIYAENGSGENLLHQALALISDHDFLVYIEQELVWTINTAIIAYGEKTKETTQITDIAKRVRDTISLGLESLLHQQDPNCLLDANLPNQALELLEKWSIKDLFKHGFAACGDLQQETQNALKKPAVKRWFELDDIHQADTAADQLEHAFITAILGRHPLQSGYDFNRPEAVKAFSCLADLDVAKVRLGRIVEQICPT